MNLFSQNAVERPPSFLGGWGGSFCMNIFVVGWVLVVGFGFGGWASMINFIRQIDTFGLFTKCYQCPPHKVWVVIWLLFRKRKKRWKIKGLRYICKCVKRLGFVTFWYFSSDFVFSFSCKSCCNLCAWSSSSSLRSVTPFVFVGYYLKLINSSIFIVLIK